LLRVGYEQAANDGDYGVERHKDSSLPELVRGKGNDKGVDGADDVWRSGEEETTLVRVAQTLENDGKEVGKGITLRRCKSVADWDPSASHLPAR
jgi:hypothetical protein